MAAKYVNQTPFAEKLNKLKLEKNLTLSDISKVVGFNPQAVGKWLNGTNRPDYEALKKLSKFFAVTIDELLDNDVVPLTDDEAKITLVPVINLVQAGLMTDINNDYDTDEYIPVANIKKGCFALRVQGDSMSPKLLDNDIVFVDPSRLPTTGDCVVATTEHEEKATLKKYRERFDDNGQMYFELVPINPDYPTFNSKQFKIIIKGVVFKYERNL